MFVYFIIELNNVGVIKILNKLAQNYPMLHKFHNIRLTNVINQILLEDTKFKDMLKKI